MLVGHVEVTPLDIDRRVGTLIFGATGGSGRDHEEGGRGPGGRALLGTVVAHGRTRRAARGSRAAAGRADIADRYLDGVEVAHDAELGVGHVQTPEIGRA